MRAELQKILNSNRSRLASELYISVGFLAKLLEDEIITPEQREEVGSKATPTEQADHLISILARRNDECFRKFVEILKEEHSDLAAALSGRTSSGISADKRIAKKEWIEISTNNEQLKSTSDERIGNFKLENCTVSDIVNGFKKVEPELVHYLDPENGLLECLKDKQVIPGEIANELAKLKPYQDLNKILLSNHIAPEIEDICKPFLDALVANKQEHIAKFIVCSGNNCNTADRLLNSTERYFIDENMFCLKNLINPNKTDLLHKLVSAECITDRHRARVEREFQDTEEKINELLIILKRRRFRDYWNFIECLRETGQDDMAEILEKGGVAEILVKVAQLPDEKIIDGKQIDKITGYDEEENDNRLDQEQKKIIEPLLRILNDDGIYLIGSCLSKGMSLFFRYDTDKSLQRLKTYCNTRVMNGILDSIYRVLLQIPDNFVHLVNDTEIKQYSDTHVLDTNTVQLLSDINLIGSIAIKKGPSAVLGVTWLENKIYLICEGSNRVHVFPDQEQFDESIDEMIVITGLKEPTDIVASEASRSIFISDYSDKQCLWKIHMTPSKPISQWRVGWPWKLSINNLSDKLLVIEHRDDCSYLNMYRCDNEEQIKSISLSEFSGVRHVVQSSNGNFIILFHTYAHSHKVCLIGELSTDGMRIIRTLDPQSSKSIELNDWWPSYLSIDEDDNVFVADAPHHRIVLLNPRLDAYQILVKLDQHRIYGPQRLCYVPRKQMLIVGHSWSPSTVALFSVSNHRS